MTLPQRDTVVTYPTGALRDRSRALHVGPAGDGRVAVITESTSFHAVDAAWPDQPADTGLMRVGEREVEILDAVVAATDGRDLHLGSDIPVRPGTDGWSFVVAHLVDGDARVTEGDLVEVEADAATRRALSVGHTACHLASLALNRALAPRWSKPVREDSLGSPDFDGIANAASRIEPNGSVDTYRLNKSLRRAGFDAQSVAATDLGSLAASVDATLAAWCGTDAPVRIDRDGEALTDRRTWVCELPGGDARIPCGGTHVTSLGELGRVRVSFELDEDAGTRVLTMLTRAEPER
ncbi:metal-dependent hydrolase [Agromyces sp. Marseille-P2726]|uniref:metal-dependent hydrolase n=1 Tax=Agromyces sp. Marseille-P2726 TaxID=2709132 RepID=UPI00156E04E7|nr:metal-dependent hydrolase [Agromyces sp. Marseille-P2726]